MPAEPANEEARILGLFTGVGVVATPQPSAKAWLASDVSSGENRPVIIKRVPATGKVRATESLALLHPNIVRTRRWIAASGFIYVLRDVVKGKNLRQSLLGPGSTRPSPELIRRLLLPVLDALAYAHQHNVLHGGISPENLIITNDTQTVMVTDWATADPQAPHHFSVYKGEASVLNDVRAVARILSAYLPDTGAFSNPQVRGRIEGVINRCDTLADLRVTLETLEKLAASPAQKAARIADFDLSDGPPPSAQKKTPDKVTAAPADRRTLRDFDLPLTEKPKTLVEGPRLFCEPIEKQGVQIAMGGGGAAAMHIRNDGNAPLILRMIATQHAWMNVRPLELPLTLAPGASVRVEFVISAARLSPGAYRSEIYFSANAGGQNAQDLREGWFKHTCEIRVGVTEAMGTGLANSAPVYPPNAPRLPAAPLGCGATLFLFPVVFLVGVVQATYYAFFA